MTDTQPALHADIEAATGRNAETVTYATCPLRWCDELLGIEVSSWGLIGGAPGARLPDARHPLHGYWKLVCAEGHVVDEGAAESDGRSPLIGYRRGQAIGGLR